MGGNGSDTEEEGRGRRHTFGSPSSSSADLKIAKIKSSQNVTYMSAPPVKKFAQPWVKKVKPLIPSDETCSEAVGPSVVLVIFSFDQGAKHHFPPPPNSFIYFTATIFSPSGRTSCCWPAGGWDAR